MRRIVQASPAGLTACDLDAAVRWMRSVYGPLHAEWESGSLSTEDGPSLTFRRLLHLLDGSEADLKRIAIFGSPVSVREIRALISMYRRLRRAARRMREVVRVDPLRGANIGCADIRPVRAEGESGGE